MGITDPGGSGSGAGAPGGGAGGIPPDGSPGLSSELPSPEPVLPEPVEPVLPEPVDPTFPDPVDPVDPGDPGDPAPGPPTLLARPQPAMSSSNTATAAATRR